jgi:hypothetical protein
LRPRFQRPSLPPKQPNRSQNHRLPRFGGWSCRKLGRARCTKLHSYRPVHLHPARNQVGSSAENRSLIVDPQADPVLLEDSPSVPWGPPANSRAARGPNTLPALRRVADLRPVAQEDQADVQDSVHVPALADRVRADSVALARAALAVPVEHRRRRKLRAPNAQARPRAAVDVSSIRRPRKAR